MVKAAIDHVKGKTLLDAPMNLAMLGNPPKVELKNWKALVLDGPTGEGYKALQVMVVNWSHSLLRDKTTMPQSGCLAFYL